MPKIRAKTAPEGLKTLESVYYLYTKPLSQTVEPHCRAEPRSRNNESTSREGPWWRITPGCRLVSLVLGWNGYATQRQCLTQTARRRPQQWAARWLSELTGARRTRPATRCSIFLTQGSRWTLIVEFDCCCRWDHRLPSSLAMRLSRLSRSTLASVCSYLRVHRSLKSRDVFDPSPKPFGSFLTGTTMTRKEKTVAKVPRV